MSVQLEEGLRWGGRADGGVVDTWDTLVSYGAMRSVAPLRSLLAGGANDPSVRLPDDTPEVLMLLCCFVVASRSISDGDEGADRNV